MSGLWPSRWPAEDGGPARRQTVPGALGLRAGEELAVAAVRDAFATTMVVLREPGEVYALRHTIGPRPRRDPAIAWVERIDPLTLEVLARSADLDGGPFWPGGLAAHADGALHVVFGRHVHRLSADLDVRARRELAAPRPHNSFVVLHDGSLAVKDLDLETRAPATLSVLDPETLADRAAPLRLPEPVIARLSAEGDHLYVVGTTTAWRVVWDGSRLELDRGWSVPYHGGPEHGHGWDPVIAGGHVWLLDNGEHDYSTTMLGAGRARGAVRLHRIAVDDPDDREAVPVCGRPRGAVTDPPLYDARRHIALGYDSANGVVAAFRHGDTLQPLWQRELAHAAHMILFEDSGEVVLHHHRAPAFARSRLSRALGRRSSAPAQSAAVRRVLGRRSADEVVVLDVETGEERGRAAVPSMFQSVLFPAPGFGRDLYWCTFSTLARLEVRPGPSTPPGPPPP